MTCVFWMVWVCNSTAVCSASSGRGLLSPTTSARGLREAQTGEQNGTINKAGKQYGGVRWKARVLEGSMPTSAKHLY